MTAGSCQNKGGHGNSSRHRIRTLNSTCSGMARWVGFQVVLKLGTLGVVRHSGTQCREGMIRMYHLMKSLSWIVMSALHRSSITMAPFRGESLFLESCPLSARSARFRPWLLLARCHHRNLCTDASSLPQVKVDETTPKKGHSSARPAPFHPSPSESNRTGERFDVIPLCNLEASFGHFHIHKKSETASCEFTYRLVHSPPSSNHRHPTSQPEPANTKQPFSLISLSTLLSPVNSTALFTYLHSVPAHPPS